MIQLLDQLGFLGLFQGMLGGGILNQSLRFRFCYDGGGVGNVIHVDLTLVPDKIISYIMGGFAQMEHDMGEEATI